MNTAVLKLGRLLGSALTGVLVGLVGTVAHRFRWTDVLDLPVGIVGALALVFCAAAMCRAWAGFAALGAFGLGWIVLVQLMALSGPGGDLIVASQAIGYIWIYGGLAIIAIAAFLPAGWFSDQPIRRMPHRKRRQPGITHAKSGSAAQNGSQG